MRSNLLLLAVGAMAAASAGAAADVTTVISSRDNTLFESPSGSVSNGAGVNFFVGKTTSNSIRRGLLMFDLSSVPAGATVTGVTLTLNCSQAQGGTSLIDLHRALADWGEGTSASAGGNGAPATAGDATWVFNFFPVSIWANQGGDFSATVSGSQSVLGAGVYTWSSSTMVADVQSWIDNASANFGWVVTGDESASGTAKRFDTRENIPSAFRPTLHVEYTIPAPGAGMILGAGGVIGLRRRRR